jgi:hypothetical protein
MNYPDNLKDLQVMCQKHGLKFKGKRKAELVEALKARSSVEVESDIVEDIEKLKVGELREKCKEQCLSVYGTKCEMITRLQSFKDNESDFIPVVQWNGRGRRVATRPSETVDNESEDTDEEEDYTYKDMKKIDLRQECVARKLPASGNIKALIKRLEENDSLKDDLKKNPGTPDKLCESCEENANKLYETPVAKWFCQECDQYICTLCKEAHEKIKIVRTHLIMPFGTILEFNIDSNVTVENITNTVQVPKAKPQFLDLTLSVDDLGDDDFEEPSKKRKQSEDDENDNSFEVVYETPYAKIGHNSSKRVRIDMISSATPILTPPPAWVSPVPTKRTVGPNGVRALPLAAGINVGGHYKCHFFLFLSFFLYFFLFLPDHC